MAALARKLLVFGAGGQVGRELTLGQTPAGVQVDGVNHDDADITDAGAVSRAVLRYTPDVIVNAAAYTAVDKAESDPDRAFAVNENGPRILARAARDAGAVLIHLSTDYVFDGRKSQPYLEDDAVAPASVYGRSKAAGEQAVREACPRHLILRTAWVYAAHGQNFLRTMLRLARERDLVRVVADQHGTPTAAADIAQAIFALAPKLGGDAEFGTFHLTNSGRTTWHGFAEAIFADLKERGLPAPRVEAITTAEYPTPATRPAMSVLDGSKLERSYGLRLRPWQTALRDTVDALLAAEMERSSA